jgi:CMP-N-acetylneuraminic acid synthetase
MPEIATIVINTDARELLEGNGVREGDRITIRDRKESLRGDTISMNRILADDVAAVASEVYLMTHTTNPLLRPATIQAALRAYSDGCKAGSCDSLFTVNKVQTRFYRADGSAVNHDPRNLVRTQDLEPWFEENSNLYIFSSKSFAASGARIGQRPYLFETPRQESIDIDDEDGWKIAESIALTDQVQKLDTLRGRTVHE